MPPKPKAPRRVVKKTIDDDDYHNTIDLQKYEKMDYMDYKAMDKVTIEVDHSRTNFSEEENMRAYRLFQIMDIDGSGNVDLREIKRVLMSDMERIMEDSFDHADCGIIWGLDEQNCVVIKSVEKFSPATKRRYLLPGLRLKTINDKEIPLNGGKKSLDLVHKMILRTGPEDPLNMIYYEPLFILSPYTNVIDIEVEGEMFSAEIEVGAIYEHELFEERVKEALVKCHKSFKFVDVSVERKHLRVIFHSDVYPFKLLFQTGKNFQKSCRYAIGFTDEDYGPAYHHEGADMLMSLELGIDEESVDLLINELFSQFDDDGSGEFEFEEFRSFYLQLLDSEESMQRLRDYAAYRFRDQELEEAMEILKQEEVRKRERRVETRRRNQAVKEKQKLKDLANSYIDEMGVRRRLNARATEEGRAKEAEAAAIKLKEIEDKKVSFGADETKEYELTKEEIAKQKSKDKAKAKRKKRAVAAHKKQKEVQERARLEQLAAEAALIEKQNAFMNLEMSNIVSIFRELSNSTMRVVTDFHGVQHFAFKQDKVISPALSLQGNVFSKVVRAKDIGLINLPSTKMHPGALRYFFVRRDNSLDYDPSRMHPSFFFADFVRQPSRHSSYALGAARILNELWQRGMVWRERNGVKYEGYLEDQPKSRIIYNPEPPKKNPIIGRVVIEDMHIFDLKSASPIFKNSPSVVATCGKKENKTKPLYKAGANASWTDLSWEFPLKQGYSLELKVYSGMYRDKVLIGTFSLTSHTAIDTPADIYGNGEILGPLMNGRSPVGQVRLHCKLDRGEPWDWVIAMYRRKELRHKNRKKELKQQKLSASLSAIEKEMIITNRPPLKSLSIPCTAYIYSIYAFDLKRVHTLRTNSPMITLECGSWKADTVPRYKAGSSAEWVNLTLECPVLTTTGNIVVIVSSVTHSGAKVIGRYYMPSPDLLLVPRNEEGISEIVGNLVGADHMEAAGKVKLILRVNPHDTISGTGTIADSETKDAMTDDSSMSTARSSSSSTSYTSDGFTTVSTASDGSNTYDPKKIKKLGKKQNSIFSKSNDDAVIDDGDDGSNVNIIGGDSNAFSRDSSTRGSEFSISSDISTNINKQSASDYEEGIMRSTSVSLEPLKFPLMLHVTRIEVMDLKSVHFLRKNSPSVQMQCGTKILGTRSQKRAGDTAEWLNLEMSMRIREKASLYFRVLSDGVMIGHCEVFSHELANVLRTDIRGSFEYSINLKTGKADQNDQNFTGSLTFAGEITEAAARFRIGSGLDAGKDASLELTVGSSTTDPSNANNSNGAINIGEAGVTSSDDQINSTTIGLSTIVAGTITDQLEEIDEVKSAEQLEREKMLRLESSLSMSTIKVYDIPEEPPLSLPLIFKVLAIQLYELIPIHKFTYISSNSPKVMLAAGRFRGTTNIKKNTGDKAEWTDIDWAMKLFGKTFITFKVVSGSSSFGTLKLRSEDLLDIPRDSLGLTEILGVIRNKNDRITGRMKILCRLESTPFALDSFVERGVGATNMIIDEGPDSDSDESTGSLGAPPADVLSTVHREATYHSIVRIYNIALFNLPNVHVLSSNQPYVQVGCGSFEWRTPVAPDDRRDGGAEWNVDWEFGIRNENKLRLDTISRNILINSRVLLLSDILPVPTNDNGIKEMFLPMYNRQGGIGGKLRLRFTMRDDVPPPNRFTDTSVYDAPPVREASQTVEPITDLHKTFGDVEEERLLAAPANSIRDHGVQSRGGVNGRWVPEQDMSMPTGLQSPSFGLAPIRGDSLVDASSPLTHEDLQIQPHSNGTTEQQDQIMVPHLAMSKHKRPNQMRIRASGVPVPATSMDVNVDGAKNGTGYPSVQSPESPLRYGGSVFSHESSQDMYTINDRNVGKYVKEGVWKQKQASLLPVIANIVHISCVDLKAIHMFGNNSPKVILTCTGTEWSASTSTIRKAGATAAWTELDIEVLLSAGTGLALRVVSGNSTIGQCNIRAEDIVLLPRDADGSVDIMSTLFSGQMSTGRVKMRACLSRFNASVSNNNPLYITPAINNEKNVAGVAQNSIHSSTSHLTVSASASGSGSHPLSVDRYPQNLRKSTQAFISMISCTDLRNVHSLGPNSPFVVIESGAFKTATEVIARGGSHGMWTNLDHDGSFNFVVGPDDNLKFTVLSGQTVIGILVLSAVEVMDTPADSTGMREVYRPLVRDGRTNGNLRFNITFERIDEESLYGATQSQIEEEQQHMSFEHGSGSHPDAIGAVQKDEASLLPGAHLEDSLTVKSARRESESHNEDDINKKLLKNAEIDTNDDEIGVNNASNVSSKSLSSPSFMDSIAQLSGDVSQISKLSQEIRERLSTSLPVAGAIKAESDYGSDEEDDTLSEYSLSQRSEDSRSRGSYDSRSSHSDSTRSRDSYASSRSSRDSYDSRRSRSIDSRSDRSGDSYSDAGSGDGDTISTMSGSRTGTDSSRGHVEDEIGDRNRPKTSRSHDSKISDASRPKTSRSVDTTATSSTVSTSTSRKSLSEQMRELELAHAHKSFENVDVYEERKEVELNGDPEAYALALADPEKPSVVSEEEIAPLPVPDRLDVSTVLDDGAEINDPDVAEDYDLLYMDASIINELDLASSHAKRLVASSLRRAVRRMMRQLRVLGGVETDAYRLGYPPHHLQMISPEDIRHRFAKLQVTQCIRIGVKRHLQNHHPLEAALLENSQGSFVQGDLGVPSHLVSEMASNIALNIKPEMSIDSFDSESQNVSLNQTSVTTTSSSMRRRRGVVMQHSMAESSKTDATILEEGGSIIERQGTVDAKLKDARMQQLYKSRQVQAMITVTGFEGFSTKVIPQRIFPTRPYLTARIAGQENRKFAWKGETAPLWRAHTYIPEDMTDFSWPNINLDPECKGFGESFKMRVFQDCVFDIVDGGSGLLVASLRVGFDELMLCERGTDDSVTMHCDLMFSPNYGGRSSKGYIHFIVDTRPEVFVLPPLPDDYWEHHQSQHWTTMPIPPIATGIVRQNFKDISTRYDRMMIVHPCFFGFSFRFKGSVTTNESHFIHPMYSGFQMLRKPMTKKQLAEIELENARKKRANPYKWDPEAASMGKCPVCMTGLPGCPRCYMLPRRKNGDATKPSDYEFDLEKDANDALEREQRKLDRELAAIKDEKMQKLEAELKDGEDDDDNSSQTSTSVGSETDVTEYDIRDEILTTHTRLTTIKGIKNYREASRMLTVYVKVMPGGYIKKLGVSADCSTSHLLNMFQSHSVLGTKPNMKLLLPTANGLFLIDNGIEDATEKLIKDATGYDTMERYGIHENGGSIVIIYFENFLVRTVPFVLQSFFKKNTLHKIDLLPVYENLVLLPDSMVEDNIQKYLLEVLERQYRDQEHENFMFWYNRGKEYRNSASAHTAVELEKKRKAKIEDDERMKQEERRIESQLAKLSPEERDIALQEMKKREAERKGFVSQEAIELMEKRAKANKERIEKMKAKREKLKEEAEREVKAMKEKRKREKYLRKITGDARDSDSSFSDEDEEEEPYVDQTAAHIELHEDKKTDMDVDEEGQSVYSGSSMASDTPRSSDYDSSELDSDSETESDSDDSDIATVSSGSSVTTTSTTSSVSTTSTAISDDDALIESARGVKSVFSYEDDEEDDEYDNNGNVKKKKDKKGKKNKDKKKSKDAYYDDGMTPRSEYSDYSRYSEDSNYSMDSQAFTERSSLHSRSSVGSSEYGSEYSVSPRTARTDYTDYSDYSYYSDRSGSTYSAGSAYSRSDADGYTPRTARTDVTDASYSSYGSVYSRGSDRSYDSVSTSASSYFSQYSADSRASSAASGDADGGIKVNDWGDGDLNGDLSPLSTARTEKGRLDTRDSRLSTGMTDDIGGKDRGLASAASTRPDSATSRASVSTRGSTRIVDFGDVADDKNDDIGDKEEKETLKDYSKNNKNIDDKYKVKEQKSSTSKSDVLVSGVHLEGSSTSFNGVGTAISQRQVQGNDLNGTKTPIANQFRFESTSDEGYGQPGLPRLQMADENQAQQLASDLANMSRTTRSQLEAQGSMNIQTRSTATTASMTLSSQSRLQNPSSDDDNNSRGSRRRRSRGHDQEASHDAWGDANSNNSSKNRVPRLGLGAISSSHNSESSLSSSSSAPAIGVGSDKYSDRSTARSGYSTESGSSFASHVAASTDASETGGGSEISGHSETSSRRRRIFDFRRKNKEDKEKQIINNNDQNKHLPVGSPIRDGVIKTGGASPELLSGRSRRGGAASEIIAGSGGASPDMDINMSSLSPTRSVRASIYRNSNGISTENSITSSPQQEIAHNNDNKNSNINGLNDSIDEDINAAMSGTAGWYTGRTDFSQVSSHHTVTRPGRARDGIVDGSGGKPDFDMSP